MLRAGLPASQAILYFIGSDDPGEVLHVLRKWQRSPSVRRAMASLLPRPWEQMTGEEQMQDALKIHYSQLSLLLHSENYIEADPATKAKMDAARNSIETKLAGQAGKMSAMDEFFSDLKSGRVRLPGSSPVLPGRPS